MADAGPSPRTHDRSGKSPPHPILLVESPMIPSPSPQGPNLTTKVTNLIPLGAAIVAVALGWGEMKNQMASEQKFREDAILKISQDLARSAHLYDKLENRTRELESRGARIDERFTLLLTLMSELKVQVSALTEKSSIR